MENVDDSTNIGDRKVFWETAKHSIYEAICEKRNAVQTAIKKKWIGKTFIHVFFIESVRTYVRDTNRCVFLFHQNYFKSQKQVTTLRQCSIHKVSVV